jgi:uncharacterized protein
MRQICLAALCLFSAGAAFAADALAADPGPNTAVLATGGDQTVFDVFGKALCAQGVAGVTCETRTTNLWQDNINGLVEGTFNFALLSSDRLKLVVEGDVEVPKVSELRAVLALPATQVTILARPDRNISAADDLRRRPVRTAPVATLGPFLAWLEADGWGGDDLAGFGPMGFENSVNGVCAGAFDAFVFVDGHPGELTNLATRRCPLKLVPLADETAAKLPSQFPEIVTTTIAAGLYPGEDRPIASIGGYIVLLTLASTPDALVERWLTAVLAGYGDIQKAHLSLPVWPIEKLRPRSFAVPMHPGAERGFAAKGITPRL